MPTYVFKCPEGHIWEKFKRTPYKTRVRYRCKECGLYMHRDIQAERVNISGSGLGVNGKSSVYWPSKGLAKGRWIENLTPEPVFVENKDQYRKLLKDTHSIESG